MDVAEDTVVMAAAAAAAMSKEQAGSHFSETGHSATVTMSLDFVETIEAEHMVLQAIVGAERMKQADVIASLGKTCTRLEERLQRAEEKQDRLAQEHLIVRALEEPSGETQLLREIESCLQHRINEVSRGGGKPRRRVCSPPMASFLSIILSREYSFLA